jgi:hypothetical protein
MGGRGSAGNSRRKPTDAEIANEVARDVRARLERVPAEVEPAAPEPTETIPPVRPAAEPVSGQMSDQPLEPNGWDDMDFNAPVAYHEDGPIGYALSSMGTDRRMDVDGQPLANVLGRVATDVMKGQCTPQEGVDAYKAVRDRLPADGPARAELDRAISKIDAPAGLAPVVPDATPEPLRQLAAELHAIPLVRREPETELAPLLELCHRAASGMPGGLVAQDLRRLANKRHESFGDSGKFAIDRAIQNATHALRNQRPRS